MGRVELSVGGKTFIAGEYLALSGGPALVLTTEPRFTLEIEKSTRATEIPFHSESPAGKLWLEGKSFFSQYHFKFTDPYLIGGFGASTAQFALLHAFYQTGDKVFQESERFFDWHQMLNDYRRLAMQGGMPPSGADLVGLCAGGLTWFDRTNGKLQTFSWPFQEYGFLVAHTGHKLPTHDHLKTLGDFPVEGFQAAMSEIHKGLSQVQFMDFLQGLRQFRTQLELQGRVASNTVEILKILEAHEKIIFAKGCGAMGNDVIFVLFESSQSETVRQRVVEVGLKVFADSSQVTTGLRIRPLPHSRQELIL